VVLSGIDTTQAVVVAGQRFAADEKVYAIAYDSTAGCDEAPAACLGVPYYNWGPAYADLVTKVQAGEWKQTWDFIQPSWDESSIVGFKSGEGLSEEAAANLDAFIAEMQAYAADPANADSIFLWSGPLNLQDGTELAPEGEKVDLLKVWYLPQLLEGMTGASQ
ncbi:MAG TPA: hypothetical protein VHL11_01150, partial [Phototrophicaceae bacterium]|nr:hypothetical protein [Phototrophicaceae bacterium]